MILVNIENKTIEKKDIHVFEVNNMDYIYFNFNVSQYKLKINSDNIVIKNNKLEIFRCGFPIVSLDIDDIEIYKVLSYIPLDTEINGLILHEMKYEYIIRFKKINSSNCKHKTNYLYIMERNPIDYTYIKK